MDLLEDLEVLLGLVVALAFIVGIPLLLFYFLRSWIDAYDAREADKELRKDLESTTERRENHPEHDSTPSRPTTS